MIIRIILMIIIMMIMIINNNDDGYNNNNNNTKIVVWSFYLVLDAKGVIITCVRICTWVYIYTQVLACYTHTHTHTRLMFYPEATSIICHGAHVNAWWSR